ncbi:MAG: peptidase T [Bacteroidales bacterium]|nr:peptidase T [Bacteroidales bacterium]MDD7082800.1 peptidase T [Bacteroidales bacterium]MDD7117791.1 peptidase T [Bacteroidales bacterium]MDY5261626.1 peptidase T [Candidatus Cryptobacteroides sp.]MDY5443110.1 peptidase T [Candidatus Cryptobacteroides sp.]
MEKILDRFLRYVSVDTQSDENSESQPSSAKQLDLLRMLRDELTAMGVEATLDEYGYVMATLPSNIDRKVPVVGFIAHVDTSPDASGANVRPQIIENYDGGDIALKGVPGLFLKPSEFPELLGHKGETIITTDGTTLLGADDKAGVAEIMNAVQYMVEHPEFKHGEIKIGFTPDEEIGRGVVKFDVKKFGAEYAYTMDGGEVGELEFENFNAASAKIHIQGRNVHPGYAKGKMKNAILIGMELNSLLPVQQRPEFTEGYEGFFHIISFKGSVEEADFGYIIRDHDRAKFEEKKEVIGKCVAFINEKYGEGTASLEVKDQYYNMRQQVEPYYFIVEKAVKAMEMEGIEARIQPIRGGTDGANLSFKGLPCPNIFAGGLNFHGKMEFAPLESIEKASRVVLNIISLFAE